MLWRQTARLTPEDLERIIKAELAPVRAALVPMQATLTALATKVDVLTGDHVPRADIDSLRREIQDSFRALDSRYYSRELADQRYKELRGDIDTLNSATAARATQEAQERISQRNYQVNWSLTALSLLVGFLSLVVLAATHFAFHP